MEAIKSDRIGVLLSWRDQVRKELAELRKQQAELEDEVSKKDSQLRNILGLLECEGYAETRRIPSELSSNSSIADYAYSTLRELGHPAYYRDMAAKMLEMGVPIPGKDPAANLISHMGRDDRFKRVKRGTYALAEWKIGTVRKRRSRKKRRK